MNKLNGIVLIPNRSLLAGLNKIKQTTKGKHLGSWHIDSLRSAQNRTK